MKPMMLPFFIQHLAPQGILAHHGQYGVGVIAGVDIRLQGGRPAEVYIPGWIAGPYHRLVIHGLESQENFVGKKGAGGRRRGRHGACRGRGPSAGQIARHGISRVPVVGNGIPGFVIRVVHPHGGAVGDLGHDVADDGRRIAHIQRFSIGGINVHCRIRCRSRRDAYDEQYRENERKHFFHYDSCLLVRPFETFSVFIIALLRKKSNIFPGFYCAPA